MSTHAPTIFALSSGAGRAGVAVIRVSGRSTSDVIVTLTRAPVPPARTAALRVLRRPGDAIVLDRGLVLWFPGPSSFTGEDCAEFHVHGGRAVVAGLMAVLGAMPGLRMAEPGEFTRRAFENGKLDLTAAEGLADLIEAETDAQRAQALRQLDGGLAATAEVWRTALVRAMGLVEAAIDFSDEGDVTARVTAQARSSVATLSAAMTAALADGRRGEILREGFMVVIAGPPNAGKSSLLNALAKRDVAIVSDEPGTTRDVVEVRLDIGGVPVLVMDTAGIRNAPGLVEREGIRRSLARLADADLVLWLEDMTAPSVGLPEILPPTAHLVRIATKADLVSGAQVEGRWSLGAQSAQPERVQGLALSTVTGEGVETLLRLIGERAAGVAREPALITRARHRVLIEEAAEACRRFLEGEQSESEFRAEDLRQAAHALGKLTGRVDVEEVLGEIFGRFCIGK